MQAFTVSSISGFLTVVALAALPILIAIATRSNQISVAEVNSLITQTLSTAATISLVAMSFSNLQDKSTLDKNRVSYLVYGKKVVAAGKVTGGSLQFFLRILSAYLVAIIIAAFGKWDLSQQNAGKVVVYLVGFTCYFTMVQTGTRYILAAFNKLWVRGLLLALWGTLTIGGYMAITTVNLVTSTGASAFFVEGRQWLGFVPFLNIAANEVMVSNFVDSPQLVILPKPDLWNQVWPVLLMAAESVLVCVLV